MLCQLAGYQEEDTLVLVWRLREDDGVPLWQASPPCQIGKQIWVVVTK